MEKQYKLVNGVQIELSKAELKEYYDRQPSESQLLEQVKKEKISQCQTYLNKTAWYVERLNDPSSGEEIPQNILVNRANARTWQVDIKNCQDLEELNLINISWQ